MIRRSGVKDAVAVSNTRREMPRRAANGQTRSMQPWKFAAAARIAAAVINGWPEAPDSPDHSGAPVWVRAVTGGMVPVVPE